MLFRSVIRELSDSETMELALIENLQREDLTPVEEAQGYKQLIDTYNMSQDEVSKTVGKSRPAVTNALRLLNLPKEILDLVSSGRISAGHGRTLLAFKNAKDMEKAAKLVATQDISVRELERLAKKANKDREDAKVEKQSKKEKRMSYYDEVELSLNEHLGRKVNVLGGNENKGILEIEFYSKDDLFELAQLLGK